GLQGGDRARLADLPVVGAVAGEPLRDLPEALRPSADSRDAVLPAFGGRAGLRKERLDRHLAKAGRQQLVRDADVLVRADPPQVLVGGEDLALRLRILREPLHERVEALAG